MAATILHEGIHVAISAFLYDLDLHSEMFDINMLLELYRQYDEGEQMQHSYMVDNFIEPMTTALQKLDNYSSPKEYYYSLAWIGLEDGANTSKEKSHRDLYLNKNLSTIRANSKLCD